MSCLLAPDLTFAQTVESLVMPDDVARGHADIEHNCKGCHKRFDRKAQRGLCLDCHEDIANDIAAKAGFHGKDSAASVEQCKTCHTDHEGRNADIVGLDVNGFDHSMTDFVLRGGHAEVACGDCHQPDKKHREAPTDCNGCHASDDVHEGNMGTVCVDCHNETDWADWTFDHDSTGFRLEGGHVEPACSDCHSDQTHSNTPTTCVGCHRDDDIHEGRSGEACGDCHNPASWTDTSFNHARDTEFPLVGAHKLQNCDGCHSKDPFSDQLQTTCISCHLDDDDHAGHNGEDCAGCHSNDNWSDLIFDHARDADFLLAGAHVELACNDCHVEPLYEQSLATTCHGCHQDDDVHEGSQGEDCQGCHTETSWTEVPMFDHALTSFPLLGEHDNVECGDCHETQVFTDAASDCASCHIEDNPHGDRFGDDCESCHNPVAWDLWFFDHNVQADFLLGGAHVEVSCESCHRASLQSMLGNDEQCVDCHRTDDIHDGEFGPDCGRCHNSRNFTEVRSLQ